MNISSRGFANQFNSQLQVLQAQNLQYMTKLGSGHKFQKASEAPTEASSVFRVQSSRMELGQCIKNGTYARSLTDISAQVIEKMMEVNGEVGAYSVEFSELNRDALEGIRSTINGFLEQMVDYANTQQMGTYLFSANAVTEQPFKVIRDEHTQQIKNVQYKGGEANNCFSIGPTVEMNPLTDAQENRQLEDVIKNLIEMRNAFFENPPNSEKILETGKAVIKDNETIFSDILGSLGAKATRIEHADQQNQFIMADLQKITSQNIDVDLTDMVVKFQQAQHAYQAALQAGSHVLNLSLLNYL